MTSVDRLWYLADQACQRAEQTYHRLRDGYDGFVEIERSERVSRDRFRTLARRVKATGAPYGAHTIVYRPGDEVLLVRHDGVDLWVLPGGEVDDGESFREAARRELDEEAGVSAQYEGLTTLTRVEVRCGGHTLWGVLPVFAARGPERDPAVDDPDGEISAARWFDFGAIPADTRDRGDLLAWHERRR